MLKGISLYQSLENVTDDFHLYVMAFDRESYEKLKSFSFKHMSVELLDDFETPELIKVKPTRTKAEYCWTCGPSVIWYFMKKYNLSDITYLDSDLFFMADPKVIYDEIGNSSVAITEQGISEESAKQYGRYCVQYMYFKNDEEGCKTLAWWRDKCIEWCYQRFEGDRYGDQKYLDKFPSLSPSLCVISNPSAGIAPWNMNRYKMNGNSIELEGREYPYVFYHMHGITVDIKDSVLTMQSIHHKFSKEQVETFLLPYAELNLEVLNHFYGKKITECKAHGIHGMKSLEYTLRGYLRKNKFVQWIYFTILNKTYQGHGKKF
jgi:hypothetical protein